MKKYLSAVICIGLIIALLTGCQPAVSTSATTAGTSPSGSTATTAQGETTQAPLEPYLIDIYVEGNANSEESFTADTAVGNVIMEKLGINIRYIPVVGDWNEKCALWLAGGDYPEMLQLNTQELIQSYIQAGAALAWDDYLADMPNYTRYVGENTMNVWRAISEDGKLYISHYACGDPANIKEFVPNPYPCLRVRSDLLEEQGWPNIITSSEWLEFFKTAKENHPKTDEGLNTIGLCMPLGEPWGINTMCTDATSSEVYRDQAIALGTDDYLAKDLYAEVDAQKELMKFFNSMYNEGLIDSEAFTDKYDQIAAKASSTQALGIWYMIWATGTCNAQFKEDPEMAKYEYVHMPFMVSSQEGKSYTVAVDSTPYGYGQRIVTKNCKYPERVMALWEFMASEEGQLLNGWGILGEDYTIDSDGKREITDDYYTKLFDEDPDNLIDRGIGVFDRATFITTQSEFGIMRNGSGSLKIGTRGYSPRTIEFLEKTGGYKTEAGPWGYEANSRYNGVKSYDLPLQAYASLAATDPDYDAYQSIIEYTTSMVPKLIMAKTEAEFDAIYEEIIQKRKDLGLTEIVEVFNQRINEAKDKLNIG